ncbi:MAG: oxygen-independent coproporphyrinogen III oxidase [Cyclobacteriaceae bacterium]
MQDLIEKYNVPGPRYTSYPTVPNWKEQKNDNLQWKDAITNCFWRSGKEVSIYIHLPFCESLCTYCGCTTRITKNHGVESEYIGYILKEWQLYLDTFPTTPIIKEIHLGGGTPTFFAPANLKKLIEGITEKVMIAEDFEFGFEGHPGNTTEDHLKTLANLGFSRISLGIQDFDPLVQETINRKQSFEQVSTVCDLARQYGFTSINFDLIYGLPNQSLETVSATIEKTLKLAPTRIAFYGYAHIPWIKAAQKSFEHLLPAPEIKASMYQIGKQMLSEAGYHDVGMDHFALPTDKLYRAYKDGSIHRSFMGYTTQESDLLVGLGMSSISDSWTAFRQNHKLLTNYYKALDAGEFPFFKGHQLTHEDLLVRKHILNLMCKFETAWDEQELLKMGIFYNVDLLEELQQDGLIEWGHTGVKVTESGKPFIRNVCMALDVNLWSKQPKSRFSQTV